MAENTTADPIVCSLFPFSASTSIKGAVTLKHSAPLIGLLPIVNTCDELLAAEETTSYRTRST